MGGRGVCSILLLSLVTRFFPVRRLTTVLSEHILQQFGSTIFN